MTFGDRFCRACVGSAAFLTPAVLAVTGFTFIFGATLSAGVFGARTVHAEALGDLFGQGRITQVAFKSPGGQIEPHPTEINAEHDVRVAKIAAGETLMGLLLGRGVPRAVAAEAIAAVSKYSNLRRLRPGRELTMYFAAGTADDVESTLIGFRLTQGRNSQAVAYLDFNDRFASARLPTNQAHELLRSIVVVSPEDGHKGTITRVLTVPRGGTMIEMLLDAGASQDDAFRVVRSERDRIDFDSLRTGAKFTVTFERADKPGGKPRLLAIAPAQQMVEPTAAGDSVADARAESDGANTPNAGTARMPAPLRQTDLEAVPDVDVGIAPPRSNRFHSRSLTVGKGDALFEMLLEEGIPTKDAYRAARALNRVFNLKKLQIGQHIIATFGKFDPAAEPMLLSLSLDAGDGDLVRVGRQANDRFKAGLPDLTALTSAHASQLALAESRREKADIAPRWIESPQSSREPIVLTIKNGDTLGEALTAAGSTDSDAALAIRAIKKIRNPNLVRAGQRLVAEFEVTADEKRLRSLVWEAGSRTVVTVKRLDKQRFVADRATSAALDHAIATAAAAPLPAHIVAARQSARLRKPSAPPAMVESVAPKTRSLTSARPVAAPGTSGDAISGQNGYEHLTLAKGSTLMEALVQAGASANDADSVVRAVRKHFDPRKLRAGQGLSVRFAPNPAVPAARGANGRRPLAAVAFDVSGESRLQVASTGNGSFSAAVVAKQVHAIHRRVEGTISNSLYNAAIDSGLSDPVLMELIRLFSFSVDFQRDIRKGDGFEVMFEQFVDDDGRPVRSGSILLGAMTLSGKRLALYRHQTTDGSIDYFDDHGRSVRKALMRTPIDGARLSSRFGKRRHPVLGYKKMHRGVDFAAPIGTPIYAAGNGVVEKAGWWGSYGNYVRIRHTGEYKTAYAHMKAIADNIVPGTKVRQGQVIGYLGSTGRSTGPHLHYEVLRNDRQINPMGVELPIGVQLAGDSLRQFEAVRDQIRVLYANLPSRSTVAQSTAGGRAE